MPYPDYFSKIFTHIENLETYINKTTSVQWSGLKNIHVATAPYQRQGFTPLAKGATMVMVLDAIKGHLEECGIQQKLDRYHLQREKWELLLETIGSTEMIQLLVNNFVFSELPRESFMQIAGPSLTSLLGTTEATAETGTSSSEAAATVSVEGPSSPTTTSAGPTKRISQFNSDDDDETRANKKHKQN